MQVPQLSDQCTLAVVYGVATHNPVFTIPSYDPAVLGKAYYPLNLFPKGVLQRLFPLAAKRGTNFLPALFASSKPATALVGKALAAQTLIVVFGLRALETYWLAPSATKPAPRAVQPIAVAGSPSAPSKRSSRSAKAKV